ncbi:MAG: HEAT repeat domain-containing protein, partial [Acidimicrobiales bacterium]
GRPPAGDDRRLSRLERAWRDLGGLRPAAPDDLAQVLDAAAGPDTARRQVAANLLREANPGAARDAWSRLVRDPVRAVRRATVDAMVDAGREELRPLLEQALADPDAWARWKALRGLVELGPAPSRPAIEATAGDADFRVRLEAAAALRWP